MSTYLVVTIVFFVLGNLTALALLHGGHNELPVR